MPSQGWLRLARATFVVSFVGATTACPPASPSNEEAVQFASAPLKWSALIELMNPDMAPGDQFGVSVAIDKDRAIVGAPLLASGAAAFVFVRSGSQWTFEAKLSPSADAASSWFGSAIAFQGETAVITAPLARTAYLFSRTPGGWVESAKLVPSTDDAFDNFGYAAAFDGHTVLIGAPGADASKGAAFVFAKTSSGWVEQANWVASDAAENDQFGTSVAVSDDAALVGAPWRSTGKGAAYVFSRGAGAWIGGQILTASDASSGAHFGSAVALRGSVGLVGAPDRSLPTQGFAGAAYVFARTGSSWAETHIVTASDPTAGAQFGASVALADAFAAIGAWKHASQIGGAYVFDVGTWTEKQRFVLAGGKPKELMGKSVSISGDSLVIGRPLRSELSAPGAAYVARFAKAEGETCAAGHECLTGFCVDGVCCNTACGGTHADDCQACSVASGAVKDGTCAVFDASRVCRPARSECDIADRCDGVGLMCPADLVKTNGTGCGAGAICTNGTCEDTSEVPNVTETPIQESASESQNGCSLSRARTTATIPIPLVLLAGIGVAVRRRRR